MPKLRRLVQRSAIAGSSSGQAFSGCSNAYVASAFSASNSAQASSQPRIASACCCFHAAIEMAACVPAASSSESNRKYSFVRCSTIDKRARQLASSFTAPAGSSAAAAAPAASGNRTLHAATAPVHRPAGAHSAPGARHPAAAASRANAGTSTSRPAPPATPRDRGAHRPTFAACARPRSSSPRFNAAVA